MRAQQGALGTLPYLAVGSGPPLLFLSGLSPDVGVQHRLMRGHGSA
jgi:hypothetical protein